MSRAYCQNCTNYHTEELTNRKIVFEDCRIPMDDYHSPNHMVRICPAVLNEKNDCPFFEAKSGK